ncbi:MAG: epoxide hydrolase family protein [Bryobacteraceae bacterium]|jgi:pimeloyl-ACP methyl ester carboxylesterase
MAIERFELPYSEAAVDDLHRRLDGTRWPDEIPGTLWERGVDLTYLREICTYWREKFDWKAQIEKLAAWQHFRYATSDIRIHFLHARGDGSKRTPLILTHGWPGSFLEMLKIIPLLTNAGFDVVAPSLPGFGFSDRPRQPGMNTFRIAELWAGLMTELGYPRFVAQGGDFGASVSTILGLRHAGRVAGIHLNYIPGSYRPALEAGAVLAPVEQAFLADLDRWYWEHGAYAHLQRNEPQTPAYALNDSAAGLAAWIIEKFLNWSDCGGNVENRFSKDELLSNVTLYWMTQTISSSFRLYNETKKAPLQFAPGEFVRVPCAIARFPLEAPFPPREWVARGYNIERWTEMPRGGHFAAVEEPELLAADIAKFFL